MPFALDAVPSTEEISGAINYILGNLSQTNTSNVSNGQITNPVGTITGYLYKYLAIKYADSFDGTLNFSNGPTGRSYYGVRNSNSSIESTTPSDYIWTQVTGGFGTTKFLYYLTTGGRQIQLQVATSVPNAGWVLEPGSSIDLDVTNATSSVANFVVIRVANDSSAPTDSECVSAIGRTPISGDICTLNYNNGLYSITYKYTTGWAIFQKYITADLLVASSVITNAIQVGSNPALSGNTMTGSGSYLYANGNFAMGNSSKNFVFNGTNVFLNGFQSATTSAISALTLTASPQTLVTFTSSKSSYGLITLTGNINSVIINPNTTCNDFSNYVNLIVYDSSNNIVAQTTILDVQKPINYSTTYQNQYSISIQLLANLGIGTYTCKIIGYYFINNYNGTAPTTWNSNNMIFGGVVNVYQATI